MRLYFSRRFEQAIKHKRLIVSLATNLRVSVLRTLEKYSDTGNAWENWTFERAEEALKTFYGQDELKAYKGNRREQARFAEVIRSGWPPHVWDCVESWLDACNVKVKGDCVTELNELLEIHNSEWRIVNDYVVKMDSAFLQEHVHSKLCALMQEVGAKGALEEFSEAIQKLQQGECKNAITAAHKSVESAMKTVLGVTRAKFGQLIRKTIDSGLIPEYYAGFCSNFEQILLAAGKERNLEGRGHGQGAEVIEVPRRLAEFAINLAAVVNLFLLREWAAKHPSPSVTEASSEHEILDDDIPF